MITPEYIKGYLTALRTVQVAVEGYIERRNERIKDEYDPATPEEYLAGMIQFIEGQRQTYKELVDKLNGTSKV